MTQEGFTGTVTAPPVPLVASGGLELLPEVCLALPAGPLCGDDPHLLKEGDGGQHGDHLLGQHPPGGKERVHVGTRVVGCTLSQWTKRTFDSIYYH